jgi:hypothetical protein
VILEACGRVSSDAQIDGLASRLANQSHQGVRIAARNLSPAQNLLGLIYIYDLVTAAEDGDPGPAVHQRMSDRQ